VSTERSLWHPPFVDDQCVGAATDLGSDEIVYGAHLDMSRTRRCRRSSAANIGGDIITRCSSIESQSKLRALIGDGVSDGNLDVSEQASRQPRMEDRMCGWVEYTPFVLAWFSA
jgi:hypothetical protein